MAERWVVVAITGPGVCEEPRVFGPWRSRARATAACARILAATRWQDGDSGLTAEVARIDPEHGGPDSLAALIRESRRG
jgi:hypothetical protein